MKPVPLGIGERRHPPTDGSDEGNAYEGLFDLIKDLDLYFHFHF